MSLPDDLELRDATGDDIPAILTMREAAGWGVHPWAMRAVVGQRQARCVLAVTRDGALAGVGSGISYGALGFIGNMIVAEAHRRLGVGSAVLVAVMAFLADAGCTRLELNATADGRPLYERHGFASVGASLVAHVPRTASMRSVPSVSVDERSGHDVAAVAAYDRPRFGGDRSGVLEALGHDPGSAWLVATRHDELVGYAGVRGETGRIGPLLAEEPSVAGTLMRSAFERKPDLAELRLNLPPGNRRGEAWLRSLGVELERWDGRMARGAPIARRDETLYGMAVGALG